MNSLLIAKEVQDKKLSIVCATCTKYWDGKSKGLLGCGERKCGSPFRNMSFPEYHGEIKDFTKWCFVCGERPHKLIRLKNHTRMFGLCVEHYPWMQGFNETAQHNLLQINGNDELIEFKNRKLTLAEELVNDMTSE